jgi:hypothetical protein
MGVYYMAAIGAGKVAMRYGSHGFRVGLKLMEHSYLDNPYCNFILGMVYQSPQPLVWLQEYHKAEESEDDEKKETTTSLTWEAVEECPVIVAVANVCAGNDFYVLNHTKEVYIDMAELSALYAAAHAAKKPAEESEIRWNHAENRFAPVHPVPLLCNSETSGDFYGDEDDRRSSWCGDVISTTMGIGKDQAYKNVTSDCLFFEYDQ